MSPEYLLLHQESSELEFSSQPYFSIDPLLSPVQGKLLILGQPAHLLGWKPLHAHSNISHKELQLSKVFKQLHKLSLCWDYRFLPKWKLHHSIICLKVPPRGDRTLSQKLADNGCLLASCTCALYFPMKENKWCDIYNWDAGDFEDKSAVSQVKLSRKNFDSCRQAVSEISVKVCQPAIAGQQPHTVMR